MKNIVALIIPFISFQLLAQDELTLPPRTFDEGAPEVFIEDILVDQYETVGTISGAYVGSSMLADKDLVYITLKNPSISPGDRFVVLSDKGKVVVPGEFNRAVGHHLRLKGYLEVTKVLANSVVAKIYDASGNIEIGDEIAPISDFSLKLTPKEPKHLIRGRVLSGTKDFSMVSPHDFAFLNRGSKDGLEVQDRLYVFQTAETKAQLEDELDKRNQPEVNIAELVVVHLGDHVATAYCLSANDSFRANAKFKSAISEVRFLTDSPTSEGNSVEAKDSTEDESENSQDFSPAGESFLHFSPGLQVHIDRDGVHSPRFSFQLNFGGSNYQVPFSYTALDSNLHEIKISPQYRLIIPQFGNFSKLILSGGLGPVASVRIDNSTSQTGYAFRLGLSIRPEGQWFLTDQFFIDLAPITADIYFWQYISADTVSDSKFDTTADLGSYVGMGLVF